MSQSLLRARWTAFHGKVTARLDEVMAEATPGITELIQTEALDPTPFASAMMELRSRLLGLGKKLEEGRAKLARELPPDDEGSTALDDEMAAAQRAFDDRVEDTWEDFDLEHSAALARRLEALMRAETVALAAGRPCATCGAPLVPDEPHQPSTMPCPHCGTLNSVLPGPATAMFYGGNALHALARADAASEQRALRLAERWHRRLREPSVEQTAKLRAAAKAYWSRYLRAKGQRTPGWTDANLTTELANRLKPY